MDERKLKQAKQVMKTKGIDGVLEISDRKGKRFKITRPNGDVIHFGLWPYREHGTYIDHGNDKIRDNWRARHMKIMRDGKPAYLNKQSPEFYSFHILW